MITDLLLWDTDSYIEMHTISYSFKLALYFSASVTAKLLTVASIVTKLFSTTILAVKLEITLL